MKELEWIGPRLILRFLRQADLEAFQEGYRRCLPAQNRFDEGPVDRSFMTDAWFDRLLRRRAQEAEADLCYMFHAFDRMSGASIGYGNIRTLYRGELQLGELGYTVFNLYWNRGYGSELLSGLTELAFGKLGFHRLELYINLDNPASKRVALKCNYRLEGIRREWMLEDGVWTDNEVYVRLAPDPERKDVLEWNTDVLTRT